MRIIAIIPARGGSKGIPRKNIRLMAHKPLIAYSIENALSCEYITDAYVSTDSDEIADVAVSLGCNVIMRDPKLADDVTTLDPVIYDAVIQAEKRNDCTYDYVITMQATSPLLSIGSLNDAIKTAIEKNVDAMISVVNKPHLSWKKYNDEIVPNYEKRLNRQQLPPNYLETGAFVITKRSLLTRETRMAGTVAVYPVSEEESIDIDNRNDWILAETILKRKKILFRVDGYATLGMGHIYNCITLAYEMIEHDLLFVIQRKSVEGIKKLQETNLPFKIIDSEDEIDAVIDEFKPDIWINDCLNTNEEYIRHLKQLIPRVITIEDLGSGTKYADAVINALYSDEDIKGDNIYNGWEYVCLRDEFQYEKTRVFSDEVKYVMVMFGGTDPQNYNRKLYDIIKDISYKYPNIEFHFVLGIGYDAEKNGLCTEEEKRIFVHSNVKRVTKYMKKADLAISSQGRAIFEFAAMGVPAVILSQNEREMRHAFADIQNGFINLGMGNVIEPRLIANTLDWLINTKAVRKNMYEIMKRYPLRDGLERVKSIIVGS